MRILFINNHAVGLADHLDVAAGTTASKLFAQKLAGRDLADYLIRDDRQPAASDQTLRESDRVPLTPVKIDCAQSVVLIPGHSGPAKLLHIVSEARPGLSFSREILFSEQKGPLHRLSCFIGRQLERGGAQPDELSRRVANLAYTCPLHRRLLASQRPIPGTQLDWQRGASAASKPSATGASPATTSRRCG
jgi:hypothetical protein